MKLWDRRVRGKCSTRSHVPSNFKLHRVVLQIVGIATNLKKNFLQIYYILEKTFLLVYNFLEKLLTNLSNLGNNFSVQYLPFNCDLGFRIYQRGEKVLKNPLHLGKLGQETWEKPHSNKIHRPSSHSFMLWKHHKFVIISIFGQIHQT